MARALVGLISRPLIVAAVATVIAIPSLAVLAGPDGRRATLGANRAYDDPTPTASLSLEQMSLSSALPPMSRSLAAPEAATADAPAAAATGEGEPVHVAQPVNAPPATVEEDKKPEASAEAPKPAVAPVPVRADSPRAPSHSVVKAAARSDARASEPRRITVSAPATKVGVRDSHVRVTAPYTRVAVDDGRVRVRAPFVDLDIRF